MALGAACFHVKELNECPVLKPVQDLNDELRCLVSPTWQKKKKNPMDTLQKKKKGSCSSKVLNSSTQYFLTFLLLWVIYFTLSWIPHKLKLWALRFPKYILTKRDSCAVSLIICLFLYASPIFLFHSHLFNHHIAHSHNFVWVCAREVVGSTLLVRPSQQQAVFFLPLCWSLTPFRKQRMLASLGPAYSLSIMPHVHGQLLSRFTAQVPFLVCQWMQFSFHRWLHTPTEEI